MYYVTYKKIKEIRDALGKELHFCPQCPYVSTHPLSKFRHSLLMKGGTEFEN